MYSWLQFAIQSSFALQDEFPSNIKIQLLVAMSTYSRSYHYLAVHIWNATLITLSTPKGLHAGELYGQLRLYSSCDQFATQGKAYMGPGLFSVADSMVLDSLSCYFIKQEWAVTYIMDSVPVMKYISGMFSPGLHSLELGNYFAVAILFKSYQSQAWFSLFLRPVFYSSGRG
jgi:hypothetical protein